MPTKTTKKTAAPPITELLHEDHLTVKDLFFQFEESEDDTEKETLVKKILKELYVHSTVEEEIVYPAVEDETEDAEDLVAEAENEHRVVKFLMAELSDMTADDEQFDAKVTVLCELVGHHIKEEEKEMFKKLRESDVDLEALAEEVMDRKQVLMQKPMPRMECSLSIEESKSKIKATNGKKR